VGWRRLGIDPAASRRPGVCVLLVPRKFDGSEVDMTDEAQVSESQIAVHWREEDFYQPQPSFIRQANAADPAIVGRFSEEHFPECFVEYAELLDWDRRWDTVLDGSDPPFWKWFVGGRLLPTAWTGIWAATVRRRR
jgi:hypothetical protein